MAKSVKLKLEQVRELVRKRKVDVLSKIFYAINITGDEWTLQGKLKEVNLSKKDMKLFKIVETEKNTWKQYNAKNLDISLF